MIEIMWRNFPWNNSFIGKLEVNISDFLDNKSFNNWYVKYNGILKIYGSVLN